jgi:hypothetical protein
MNIVEDGNLLTAIHYFRTPRVKDTKQPTNHDTLVPVVYIYYR